MGNIEKTDPGDIAVKLEWGYDIEEMVDDHFNRLTKAQAQEAVKGELPRQLKEGEIDEEQAERIRKMHPLAAWKYLRYNRQVREEIPKQLKEGKIDEKQADRIRKMHPGDAWGYLDCNRLVYKHVPEQIAEGMIGPTQAKKLFKMDPVEAWHWLESNRKKHKERERAAEKKQADADLEKGLDQVA